MKVLLCICCMLLFWGGYAQNKIFHTSADVRNTVEEIHGIEKIRLPWGRLCKSIRVNYADGCQAMFGKSAIWGFEKDGRKLRLYNGEIFEIVDSGAIVLYKSFSPHPVYYFSEDFNAAVVLLETRKLKKGLNDEKLLEAYKQFKIIRDML